MQASSINITYMPSQFTGFSFITCVNPPSRSKIQVPQFTNHITYKATSFELFSIHPHFEVQQLDIITSLYPIISTKKIYI